jgi:putative ribosome biogenesis GTPase RsgA
LINRNYTFDEVIGIKAISLKKDFFEFEKYHQIIEQILSRPEVFIRIAYLKDDPNIIVSYAILERVENKMLLHWVFTKEAWRKLGIAKAIIPEKIDYVTSLTKIGKAIKPIEWLFNPFLL